jgi:hypothetical protein
MEEIEAVSLAVQIKGKAYFVNASQDELKLLVQMAAGFTGNKLKVVKAPDSFKLMPISDIK